MTIEIVKILENITQNIDEIYNNLPLPPMICKDILTENSNTNRICTTERFLNQIQITHIQTNIKTT